MNMSGSTENLEHHNQDSNAYDSNNMNSTISVFGSTEDRKNIATCLAKIGISIHRSGYVINISDDASQGKQKGAAEINRNFLDRLRCNSPEKYSLRLLVKQPAPKGEEGEMLLSILQCIQVEDVCIRSNCDVSSWISLIADEPFSRSLRINCAIIGSAGCKILLSQLKSGHLTYLKMSDNVGGPTWNLRRGCNRSWNIDVWCCSDLSEVRGVDVLTTFVKEETTVVGHVTLYNSTVGNDMFELLEKAKEVEVNLRGVTIDANLRGVIATSIQNIHRITTLKIDSGLPGMHEVGVRVIEPSGCEVITSFLQDPSCNLVTLELIKFTTDDECAAVLARGIRGNNTLKDFSLESVLGENVNTITRRGWDTFSKALCDTTSISDIYFSNHALKNIRIGRHAIPSIKLNRLLVFNNSSTDRKEIALKKILRYKGRLDVSSLFELELKLLPTLVNWFDCASVSLNLYKIDAIYQFIQANPDLSQLFRTTRPKSTYLEGVNVMMDKIHLEVAEKK